MILVMGVTGAGKSYFINKLADGEITRTGAELKSCKTFPIVLLWKDLIKYQAQPNARLFL